MCKGDVKLCKYEERKWALGLLYVFDSIMAKFSGSNQPRLEAPDTALYKNSNATTWAFVW